MPFNEASPEKQGHPEATKTGMEKLIKTSLRQDAKACRDALNTKGISQQVQVTIHAWDLFTAASTILCYTAFRNEIDLLPLVALCPEKKWFLPVVDPKTTTMNFYSYRADESLQTGAYGILEPSLSSECWQADKEEQAGSTIILIPGLLFARSGHRLGYGKGYYDRFLSELSKKHPELTVLRVGITHSTLIAETLPVEAWDIPVHYLVTEQTVIKIS